MFNFNNLIWIQNMRTVIKYKKKRIILWYIVIVLTKIEQMCIVYIVLGFQFANEGGRNTPLVEILNPSF